MIQLMIIFNLAIEAFCDNASWFVFRWNLDQAGLVNILASLKCFEEMLSVDNFLEAGFLEYEDVSKKFLVFRPEKLGQKEQAQAQKNKENFIIVLEAKKKTRWSETVVKQSVNIISKDIVAL